MKEVDAIHTVQFSNHTGILKMRCHLSIADNTLGYSQWTGFMTTAEQVLELFQGLENSGIDNFEYILTGYLPNASTISAVGTIAKTLKKKDPGIIWSSFLDFYN